MKTHTELLTELIDAVYASELTLATHPLKMITAEIKGQMMANPSFAIDTLKVDKLTESDCAAPQPDADEWVENTGTGPECDVSSIQFRDGDICEYSKYLTWELRELNGDITYYKPA